jgi:nucleotide sugar dehydrogenase
VHRICVVGTGYVGLPLSALLSQRFPVIGLDVDEAKIRLLASGVVPLQEPGVLELVSSQLAKGSLRFTTQPEEIGPYNIKVLTVGTPFDPDHGGVDFSQIDQALTLLCPQLRPGDVVVVKSTVPPGTTNRRVREAVESYGLRVPDDVGLAYSPERIVEGQALQDFATLPKVIGTTDERSFETLRDVFGSLGGPVIRVDSPETAEMVKMVDNYSRYVFLGLTNEIALMCERVGVDVLQLIEAAKFEYPRNAGILRPGPGVGGSCLNKDPFILASLMQESGLHLEMVDSAARVNKSIPSHIVDLVDAFAKGRTTVVIAGSAFKKDTDDLRYTSAFEIRDRLSKKGYKVQLTDPYASAPGVLVEHDLLVPAANADILLVLTDHSVYRETDLSRLRAIMGSKPLILDTRGMIGRAVAERAGFEYHGFGRR